MDTFLEKMVTGVILVVVVAIVFLVLAPIGALFGAITSWYTLGVWFHFDSIFGYTPWQFGAIIGYVAGSIGSSAGLSSKSK